MIKLIKYCLAILWCSFHFTVTAQNVLSPETLWKLSRVSGLGISKDEKYLIYSVSLPMPEENKFVHDNFYIPLSGGTPQETTEPDSFLVNDKISPDGKYLISAEKVKVVKNTGSDLYPGLKKSNVYIFDALNYRHWDKWSDGRFDHVMLTPLINGKTGEGKDLMPGEPYDCPQKPFGGDEDFVWNPNGKEIVYCSKKKFGTAYTVSTNTDLYAYNIETNLTTNITAGMMGYDINPSFNTNGTLAWLSMKRDGFESDKQDIYILRGKEKINLTGFRDDLHVEGYKWSKDGNKIFFWAPTNGTLQIFELSIPANPNGQSAQIRQVSKGDFDINGIIGQSGSKLIVSKQDMNHATELYSLDITNGNMIQLTHVNDAIYGTLQTSKIERRFVKTTDNKQMLVWVIYPPGFDPSKKYPTLLYCQGGPQSALTQFYSFRWNFQLMAANGYIIVAPSRRGMPGFGTEWNESISKDWGGQPMRDYLSAIDALKKEPFVDNNRLGCVGASYGGFSVFELAGMHEGRFKTFIAHDGVFDFKSMYGTTDEMFFENWEKGGPYWESNNKTAQHSFDQSPSNFVSKWNTPILIFQGGKDYRVSIEQGQQAFQAAQLRGIKSRFIYLPEENHWVLGPQNALVWQHEFYRWLKETL